MKKCIYQEALDRIQKEEKNVNLQANNIIEVSHFMIVFLQGLLQELKACVLKNGFSDEEHEIHFFKHTKPNILGKLIYYSKIFSIETTCPVNSGKIYYCHYENQLKLLKSDYKESLRNVNFYKYYKSGRYDCDYRYFKLGQVNYLDGLHNDVFELDLDFSTYYDNKAAHIIANELLYAYLLTKISPEEVRAKDLEINDDISWTNSQNALIELIYALYASNSICEGKIGIRKISLIFEVVFRTPLNNIHHAFHRMKSRAGSKTAYLDQLKFALEEYMDKEI